MPHHLVSSSSLSTSTSTSTSLEYYAASAAPIYLTSLDWKRVLWFGLREKAKLTGKHKDETIGCIRQRLGTDEPVISARDYQRKIDKNNTKKSFGHMGQFHTWIRASVAFRKQRNRRDEAIGPFSWLDNTKEERKVLQRDSRLSDGHGHWTSFRASSNTQSRKTSCSALRTARIAPHLSHL